MNRQPPTPVTRVKDMLDSYAAGERRFDGADFSSDPTNYIGPRIAGENLADICLSNANLFAGILDRVTLTRGNLERACLAHSSMEDAHLEEAHLLSADLSDADLRGASFRGAKLQSANLHNACLDAADLREADLSRADFTNASIKGSKWQQAVLDETKLLAVDLTCLCDPNSAVIHRGPSHVDFRSVVQSIRAPGLASFLAKTGMPAVFVEYMIDCARSLAPKGVFRMLQSTFLSYGTPDVPFAMRLNNALQANGVTTFLFAKDAIPGRKLYRVMREGVNQHDRVILICSRSSLDRPGVLNEISETLQREARDGGKEYLIPVALDDYVFSDWSPADPGLALAVRDRVVADFRGAETEEAVFNQGLLRLISGLKK